VPLEPQDEEREFDDATQPIELADIPSHLFDEGSL
jgi:two-component system sensor histidine kinase MtrB